MFARALTLDTMEFEEFSFADQDVRSLLHYAQRKQSAGSLSSNPWSPGGGSNDEDDNAVVNDEDLFQVPSVGAHVGHVGQRKAKRARKRLFRTADLEDEGTAEEEEDVDINELSAATPEHFMGPKEEKKLRALLNEKQRALLECTEATSDLPANEKKRLRNRHASCVSRIKKKLAMCNLQRDLDEASSENTLLRTEVDAQRGTIRFFQRENKILRKRLRELDPTYIPGPLKEPV